MTDEYLLQEQDDCLEVMKWIEQQPWSNGKVGMMGISWGGFNSLQVAARNPPQLKAIVTVCSTDNRFTKLMASVKKQWRGIASNTIFSILIHTLGTQMISTSWVGACSLRTSVGPVT